MIGIILLLVTNYLAGFSIYRLFFRNSNLLEKIILPQVFSLIVTPSLFVLLYLVVGFDAAVYLLPLVIIALFFASLRIKQEKNKIVIENKWWIIGTVLALIFILSVSFIKLSVYPIFDDITFHISVANFIKNFKMLPPDNPGMYGVSSNYQWLYHTMLSLQSIYSEISVFNLFSFFTVYLFTLFLLITFYLGYYHFKKTGISLLFMTLLSLFFSGYYFVPQTQGYALVLIVLFFYLFLKFLNEKELRFGILAGLMTSGMMYVHGHSFIFMLLTLFSYFLYKLVFDCNKKFFKEFLMIAMTLLPAIPYFFVVRGFVSSMFLFEPFGGLIFNYASMFNLLLIVLPFGIYKALKNKDKTLMIFLSLLITLFVFVNSFLMIRVPDIQRYIYFMIFPILFLSLNFVKDLSPTVKKIFIVIAIAILIYPFLSRFQLVYSSESFLDSDEYAASKWIGESTNLNDTILTAPTSLYSAISERKIMLREPITLSTLGVDPREHFSDLILLYTDPSIDLVDKYKISYVVFGNLENSFFYKYDIRPFNFSNSEAFNSVYSHGNYTIYKTEKKELLPKMFNSTLRSQLNFSSYSRWWSI